MICPKMNPVLHVPHYAVLRAPGLQSDNEREEHVLRAAREEETGRRSPGETGATSCVYLLKPPWLCAKPTKQSNRN